MAMEHLQYPIGKFDYEKTITDSYIAGMINEIESLPARLSAVVNLLTKEQLEISYRPGGWKVKQVVHHLVDSHTNMYIRLNLMLTEEGPTIRPYIENRWAELPYKESLSTQMALEFLKIIHHYIVTILRSVQTADLDKTYIHPEYNRVYKLRQVIALYTWHGNHHLAHITFLKERNFDR